MDKIVISADNGEIKTAEALIGAPIKARDQQGLIQMWSVAAGQQGKYILHTLAQRAMVELEDKTLEICRYPEGTFLKGMYNDMQVSFSAGAILAMDDSNQIMIFVHEGVNIAAMLREFHRYAARMIRLDLG